MSFAILRRHPFAAATLGSLIIAWAGIFVGLADTTTATSATFRCLFALPVLALLLLVEQRAPDAPAATRATTITASVAGAGLAGRLLLWHASIALIGAGMATVLQDAQAVLVPLGAWLIFGHKPHPRQISALPVVLVGCILIAGVAGSGNYGSNPERGAVLGLGAAISYTVFQLAARDSATRGGSPLLTLTIATGVSGALTALWGLSTGSLQFPRGADALWLLALALVVQVVGWILITYAMAELSSATIALLLLLQPLGAVILGFIILDEHPSLGQWIGVAVLIAGIGIAAGRHPQTQLDAR